jgi:hypothetical protein
LNREVAFFADAEVNVLLSYLGQVCEVTFTVAIPFNCDQISNPNFAKNDLAVVNSPQQGEIKIAFCWREQGIAKLVGFARRQCPQQEDTDERDNDDQRNDQRGRVHYLNKVITAAKTKIARPT